MKTSILFFLFFFVSSINAASGFQASLGVGAQHDQSWFELLDPLTDETLFSSKYVRIWTPYFRGEISLGWGGFLASYQIDVGSGNGGKNDLALTFSAIKAPFKADLSKTKLRNERVMLNYDLAFLLLHFAPVAGWNRFENHWKIEPASPLSFSSLFDLEQWKIRLNDTGNDIKEEFSGMFVGGDLALALGPLQLTAGYRYTWGHFSTHFDALALNFSHPLLRLDESETTYHFSAMGEGHIGAATIEWWFVPFLSIYVQGEGRWIVKKPESDNPKPFHTRWDSYDITLGARLSF